MDIQTEDPHGVFIFNRESVLMRKWQILEFDGKAYYAFVPENERNPLDVEKLPEIPQNWLNKSMAEVSIEEDEREMKRKTKKQEKTEENSFNTEEKEDQEEIYGEEEIDINEETFYLNLKKESKNYETEEEDQEEEEENEDDNENDKEEIERKPILLNGSDERSGNAVIGDLYQVKVEGSTLTLEKLADNVNSTEDHDLQLPDHHILSNFVKQEEKQEVSSYELKETNELDLPEEIIDEIVGEEGEDHAEDQEEDTREAGDHEEGILEVGDHEEAILEAEEREEDVGEAVEGFREDQEEDQEVEEEMGIEEEELGIEEEEEEELGIEEEEEELGIDEEEEEEIGIEEETEEIPKTQRNKSSSSLEKAQRIERSLQLAKVTGGPLKCKVCSETFGSVIAFRKHVAWTHKKKLCIQEDGAYICAVCDYRTLKKSLFAAHLERKHETWSRKRQKTIVFPCETCGFICRSKHSLQSHFIRKHTDRYEHVCQFCPKKFKVKGDLTNHIRFHHKEKPIKCDVCGKLCQNTGSLYVHQKWAHYKPKFECHICKRRMVTQENLDQHLITQHEQREKIVCAQCGKTFTKKDSFKRHMAVHTGTKPYPCPICGKHFARQSQLRQHVLIHTGKRPFICDICGKGFTQKPGLICHRKTHPGPHPPLPVMPIADLVREFIAQKKEIQSSDLRGE